LASDEVTHVVGKVGHDFEVVARLTNVKEIEFYKLPRGTLSLRD
jgi:hypothetical protein